MNTARLLLVASVAVFLHAPRAWAQQANTDKEGKPRPLIVEPVKVRIHYDIEHGAWASGTREIKLKKASFGGHPVAKRDANTTAALHFEYAREDVEFVATFISARIRHTGRQNPQQLELWAPDSPLAFIQPRNTALGVRLRFTAKNPHNPNTGEILGDASHGISLINSSIPEGLNIPNRCRIILHKGVQARKPIIVESLSLVGRLETRHKSYQELNLRLTTLLDTFEESVKSASERAQLAALRVEFKRFFQTDLRAVSASVEATLSRLSEIEKRVAALKRAISELQKESTTEKGTRPATAEGPK